MNENDMLEDLMRTDGKMTVEWQAWQDVCKEFRAKGIEPNDKANNRLFALIHIWGERLAILRRVQPLECSMSQIRDDTSRL